MNNTKKIAVCGVFGAIATILYVMPFFKFPLPFIFPSFLEFNFSDIPTLIAGFAYGPIVAFFVHLIKILIKLPMSTTACVGELADFIIGLLFVMPAVIYYTKKDKSKKGALIGLLLSLVIATTASCFVNRYITIPFFTKAFGMEAVLSMAQASNSNITDINWSLVILGVLPFNFVKNIVVCVLSFALYKRISNVIRKYGAK
jgi:riboflavin transporter FmnP